MHSLRKLTPFQISIIGHGALCLVAIILIFDFGIFKKSKKIDFEVIQNPVIRPSNLNLQIKNEIKPTALPKPEPIDTQKVFGVSRKALTTTSENAISVKQGNTVVKENDVLKLKNSDADSLPIPADDYLVTSSARLISNVVANRTDEARKAGYTGTAILLILIDKTGIVKEAKLLNKLDYGLDSKAIEIANSLKFIPAKIKDEAVAIQIRFSINFKSSN